MGVYALDVLVSKWAKGELSPEQAIGQILLAMQELSGRLAQLEERVARWTRAKPGVSPETSAGPDTSQID